VLLHQPLVQECWGCISWDDPVLVRVWKAQTATQAWLLQARLQGSSSVHKAPVLAAMPSQMSKPVLG
jgi:hypothetical protein